MYLSGFHALLLTTNNPDPAFPNKVGWSLVITILFSIAYNMVGILKNAFISARRLWKLAKDMVVAYKEKKKAPVGEMAKVEEQAKREVAQKGDGVQERN